MPRKHMRFVVEGTGDWSSRYKDAIIKLKADVQGDGDDVSAFFTYDSTFGLGKEFDRFPIDFKITAMSALSAKVKQYEADGFPCLDVCGSRDLPETLGESVGRRRIAGDRVDAAFIVTPDHTHSRIASLWYDHADVITVEKPFDATDVNVGDMVNRLRPMGYGEPLSSRIRPVDHYGIRLHQALVEPRSRFIGDTFVRAVTHDENGVYQGPIDSFEFVMIEHQDSDVAFTRSKQRAPSLQRGLAFDMASHAFAVLSPWVDLNRRFDILRLWAGVSDRYANEVLILGTEGYTAIDVATVVAPGFGEASGSPVTGHIVIGKDVETSPQKWAKISGPRGTITIELDPPYRVFHTDPEGQQFVLPTPARTWADHLVRDIWERRWNPVARTSRQITDWFTFREARLAVQKLEHWRSLIQGEGKPLPQFAPGTSRGDLTADKFRIT